MYHLYHFQRDASMSSDLFIRKTLPHNMEITIAVREILLLTKTYASYIYKHS